MLCAIARCPLGHLPLSLAVLLAIALTSTAHAAETDAAKSSSAVTRSVADFLPKDHVTDGSVSYQAELQKAIDAAPEGATLVFPPMKYLLDETGLQLRSHLTLSMYGAVFQFDEKRAADGAAFRGKDLVGVRFAGGKIVGRNDVWADGVNIRGIYVTGESSDLRFENMTISGLSSNGIGVFGSEKKPVRDVWATDLIIENCCNRYGDYLSPQTGPEKGSEREDQGSIAFYHVDEFVVRGCRFEKSRSDGTHFYHCRRGQFVDNRVYTAKMGGYFLEGCEDVVAADNVIRDNGSRGATIERGSKRCTLRGCVVAGSGREGLWAPECSGLVITGNIFDRNGRKPNGEKPLQQWNANINVNQDANVKRGWPTEDYLIVDNIFYATESQLGSIRVEAKNVSGIVIKNNLLRGENRKIVILPEGSENVVLQGND